MNERIYYLDADESALFLRQLQVVQTQTYDVKRPDLKNRTLIPVNTGFHPGTEQIIWYSYDIVGMAKIRAAYGDDFPRVDIKGGENISRVRSLVDAYGYDPQEFRGGQLAGVPLDAKKGEAAREAIARLENKLAFTGDSDYNMVGLFNHPNVPLVVLPADGTGSTTTWATKTPAQVLRDLHLIANTVVEVTFEVEKPDTLLLPTEAFNLINSFPWSTNGDGKSILRQFLDSSTYIKQVESVSYLKDAGAGATTRMMVYTRSPRHLDQVLPVDFEQWEKELRNGEVIIPCHERYGGVRFFYPLSAAYADGL